MNISPLCSQILQSDIPRPNSPLRLQSVFLGTTKAMEKPKRHKEDNSISAAMAANMFTFALPTQLSPLSNSSHNVPSSQFLSPPQYRSSAGQTASLSFAFPQIIEPSITGPFALRQPSQPQQPLMQQYQHDFVIQGYQQQHPQAQHEPSSDISEQPEARPYIPTPPRYHPYAQEQHFLVSRGRRGRAKDSFMTDWSDSNSMLEDSQDEMAQYISADMQEVKEKPNTRPSKPPNDSRMLRGSCACCHVQYEISAFPKELPLRASYCHCATCRNLSGSNYIAFSSIPSDRIRWYCGQWDWRSGRGLDITAEVGEARAGFEFGKAAGFSTAADALRLWGSSRRAVRGSCAKCGSVLFISYHAGVAMTDIALGTLWDMDERGAPLVQPAMHLMLREKALWEHVPDDDGLLRYDGMPADGLRRLSPAPRTKETPMRNIKHLLKCMLVY